MISHIDKKSDQIRLLRNCVKKAVGFPAVDGSLYLTKTVLAIPRMGLKETA
ncbi:MAG: hypothetical protein V3R82_05275 [Candidatus Hydrothermarchaeales archaeon]